MPGDIEFLSPDVGDPPAADAPDGDAPDVEPEPPRHATTWVARGVVVALAVVVLMAWAATRPSRTTRPSSDGPKTAEPASSAAPPSLTAPRRVGAGSGITMCAAEVSDLAGLSAAIRKELPGIALDGGSSLTCGEGNGAGRRVVFESVTGTFHGVEIEVDLTARRTGSAFTAVSAPLHARGGRPLIGSMQSESAGLTVNANAYARSGTLAPMSRLRALADYLSLYFVL